MTILPILLLSIPLTLRAQEAAPLRLTLKQAVEIAVSPDGSARVRLAAEASRQAEARSAQARSALLPNLDGTVSWQSQTRNLEAVGLRVDLPIPGFQFPSLVGPFQVLDARAGVQQSVLDLSSFRRFQSSREGVKAAEAEQDSAAEQAAGQAARTYLAALKAVADVEAVKANIDLAEAVVRLAESQKRAGTGTGIDITRARVQLSSERQRLLVAENEGRRARLQLLRAMGLGLETKVELADRLQFVPVDVVTVQDAVARAAAVRPDLKAQQDREAGARLAASAARMERLPTVSGFADYGSSGTGLDRSLPTRTYGVAMKLPLFDGGRRGARRAESESQHRAEQTRTRDLREQVALEVRLALDSLRSAEEQVGVAREGLQLAESELEQAKRRYQAGVAAALEVTDSQTRIERARDNQTAALFNHNLARIDLAQAMGSIRRALQ